MYPLATTPLFETHRAIKMSAAYVNCASTETNQNPRILPEKICLEKYLLGMKLCSLHMFIFQQSLTHGRSPDGIHIKIRIKISNTGKIKPFDSSANLPSTEKIQI